MEHTKTLLTLAIATMVLTGFCVAPVVGNPFAVVCGVELTLETGIAIAGVLGMVAVQEALKNHQAEFHENLQKVSDEFTRWFSSINGWIRDDSKEATMLFDIDDVSYSHAPKGPDGNKTKWLKVCHEARVTQNGKNIEIKKEAMKEEDATTLLKQMKKNEKRGIFVPNKDAADDLYRAITKKEPPEVPEIHREGMPGYYYHYHIDGMHNGHIWMWFYQK